MSVVGWGWDGHRPGAPHIPATNHRSVLSTNQKAGLLTNQKYLRVAELVGELLQLVRLEPVVVPEDVVVGGPEQCDWSIK